MCVFLQENNRGKLDKRSIKCMFIGYAGTQKGYKCFCPKSRRIYTTLDVYFDESTPFYGTNDLMSLQGSEHKLLEYY